MTWSKDTVEKVKGRCEAFGGYDDHGEISYETNPFHGRLSLICRRTCTVRARPRAYAGNWQPGYSTLAALNDLLSDRLLVRSTEPLAVNFKQLPLHGLCVYHTLYASAQRETLDV
jgi:hypothetical protein